MADTPESAPAKPKRPKLTEDQRFWRDAERAFARQQTKATRAQQTAAAKAQRAQQAAGRRQAAAAGRFARVQNTPDTARRTPGGAPDILDHTVPTPLGDAPVIPVALLVVGAYLCWFGVHYWASDTKWPTDPLKALLTGKPIPTPDRTAATQALSELQSSAAAGAAQAAGQGLAAAGGQVAAQAAGGGQQTLSHQQLQSLWTANGGNPATADLAAAVAEAESSGRTWITSPNPDGGTNVGLWQLDTRGVGAGYTVAQLQDPATNARLTVMHSANGTNWSQWEGFTSGRYRQFLLSNLLTTGG
jgi:hypothetical protein